MADEPGEELSKIMEELDLGDSPGDLTGDDGSILDQTSVAAKTGSGARGRIAGLLAMLLGLVGSLVVVVFAALVIRFGFTASDTAARAMEPIETSFDRMEDRIDQTDDLVDREGIAPDRIDELQARVDGLVDISSAAHQGFEAIDDHPVYRLLPAAISSLGDDLGRFETASTEIDELLGSAENGDNLSSATANGVADQLDGMQALVSDTQDSIDSSESSLRRWIRLGAFLAFLASPWALWGQILLVKRGWRGFRGREV